MADSLELRMRSIGLERYVPALLDHGYEQWEWLLEQHQWEIAECADECEIPKL